MVDVLIKILGVTGLLLLPLNSFGAEAVRLTHLLSVYTDEKGEGVKQPESVACGGDSVVVADTGNGRLLKYTVNGDTVQGGTELRTPEITVPLLIKRNSQGDLFVLDGRQRRIVRLNPEGRFLAYLEPAGLPAPEAFIPRSFDIDAQNTIYVLDILSERVLVLSPEGKYLRSVPFPGDYGFFTSLAVNRRGDILILDSVRSVIYSAGKDADHFTPLTKDLKEYMNFPMSMIADAKGNIFVADYTSGGIVIVGMDGSFRGRQLRMGWKKGELRYPSGICLSGNGELFIADRQNNRIQAFSLSE